MGLKAKDYIYILKMGNMKMLLIKKKVKDPAFHNSVQFVWQLIYLTLTLLIPLPFWMFVQEYGYQLSEDRKINLEN